MRDTWANTATHLARAAYRPAMKILGLLLATILAAATLTAGPAQADDDPGADLPACTSITNLQCQGTFVNLYRGGMFCQGISGQPLRCEYFWPFRNPTANAHAARNDPEAFPRDYDTVRAMAWANERRVERLEEKLERRDWRIERQRHRIERLRHRLHQLRAR